MSPKGRWLVLAAALLLVGLGLLWSWRGPALTLANGGMFVSYPLGAWAGRALAALGCAVLAGLVRGRPRWVPAGVSVLLLLGAAQRATYSVRADGQGLEIGRLLGHERLAWTDVRRVDSSAGELRAVGLDGRVLSVPVTDWQRADADGLERTISRRVYEASQR